MWGLLLSVIVVILWILLEDDGTSPDQPA